MEDILAKRHYLQINLCYNLLNKEYFRQFSCQIIWWNVVAMLFSKLKFVYDKIHQKISEVYGFSLLEALVAFIILAALLIPVVRLVPDYYDMASRSNIRAFSISLAQDKIEEFKSRKNINDLGPTTIPNHTAYQFQVTGSRTDAAGSLTANPHAGTYNITVTIYHTINDVTKATGSLSSEIQVG